MTSKSYFPAIVVLLMLSSSCNDEEQYTRQVAAPIIDTMDLMEVGVVLPEGEGKELVEMSCVPCHSLRYIEMQPEMSKKSWEKIVTKMIKMYGAPVRDSASAAVITNYLTSLKGKHPG
jgi:hypothetical protein